MTDYPEYPLTPHIRKLRATKAKRDAKMFELYLTGEYTLKAIGVKFGINASTVNSAIHKIIRRNRRAQS